MQRNKIYCRTGEIIEKYPDDRPYPSVLILGFVKGKPFHLVMAKDEEKETCYVVTVYKPEPSLWTEDFKKRRKE